MYDLFVAIGIPTIYAKYLSDCGNSENPFAKRDSMGGSLVKLYFVVCYSLNSCKICKPYKASINIICE